MKYVKYFKESLFFPRSIDSDILSLNNDPEFIKHGIVLSIDDVKPGLINKVKNALLDTKKFGIEYTKNYKYGNHQHENYVDRPRGFQIQWEIDEDFKISYFAGIQSQIVRSDQIKSTIKRNLLRVCDSFDDYQKKQELVFKNREDREKKGKDILVKFNEKITDQFILDEFSNVFDMCIKYSIDKNPTMYSAGYLRKLIRLETSLSSSPSGNTFTDSSVIRIDNKFIDIFSELMSISERLLDNGVSMDIMVTGGVILIWVSIKGDDPTQNRTGGLDFPQTLDDTDMWSVPRR